MSTKSVFKILEKGNRGLPLGLTKSQVFTMWITVEIVLIARNSENTFKIELSGNRAKLLAGFAKLQIWGVSSQIMS